LWSLPESLRPLCIDSKLEMRPCVSATVDGVRFALWLSWQSDNLRRG
jgi:hypothetical protein